MPSIIHDVRRQFCRRPFWLYSNVRILDQTKKKRLLSFFLIYIGHRTCCRSLLRLVHLKFYTTNKPFNYCRYVVPFVRVCVCTRIISRWYYTTEYHVYNKLLLHLKSSADTVPSLSSVKTYDDPVVGPFPLGMVYGFQYANSTPTVCSPPQIPSCRALCVRGYIQREKDPVICNHPGIYDF